MQKWWRNRKLNNQVVMYVVKTSRFLCINPIENKKNSLLTLLFNQISPHLEESIYIPWNICPPHLSLDWCYGFSIIKVKSCTDRRTERWNKLITITLSYGRALTMACFTLMSRIGYLFGVTSSGEILSGCSLVARRSLEESMVPMGEPKLECFDEDS